MVPLAPWQLKPEHLQRLAPQGALFCIIIKDAYGVRETLMLHVCEKRKKKKKERKRNNENNPGPHCEKRLQQLTSFLYMHLWNFRIFYSFFSHPASHREAPKRLGWDSTRDSRITVFCSTSRFPKKQPSVVSAAFVRMLKDFCQVFHQSMSSGARGRNQEQEHSDYQLCGRACRAEIKRCTLGI